MLIKRHLKKAAVTRKCNYEKMEGNALYFHFNLHVDLVFLAECV